MNKILGIIDEDPFDPVTWSGSSRYFFNSLKDNGALYKAISAAADENIQLLYKLLSFSPSLQNWKFRYHLNTALFDSMTKSAERMISTFNQNDFDTILQVGAWYNFTGIYDKTFASYHDGNLATRLKSPYGHPDISKKHIQKAFEYERILYEKMDFIFPMSKWLASSFINDFNIDSRKVYPVGAGINLPRIAEPKPKNPDEPIILFIGKDFARKGGKVLLEAFISVRKKVKNARLIIAGPENISNLPEGVTNKGYISKASDEGIDKLISLYSEADIFVLPSLYEPFGIAIAEAMAHYLPCIGTDNCAMPEIIDDGLNGFIVPPNDAHALSEKIVKLLQEPALRNSMGEEAFIKYHFNYRWDIVTTKITNSIEMQSS